MILSFDLFAQEDGIEKVKSDTLEYGMDEISIVGTRTEGKNNRYSLFSI